MGQTTSKTKTKKKQYFKIGSSKYKIVSVQSSDDVVTKLIVSDTKTKEEYLMTRMLINNGSNTIDYLSGADILSRLPSHPNIVRYIGSSHFVHQDGSIEFALLTENCSSWLNLQHLMEQKILNDFTLKLKAFEDICHSIQHCHKNSIAHLSIHPCNILQDGFGTFKITNFDSSMAMNSGGISSNNNNNFLHNYTRNSIFSAPNINNDEHKTPCTNDTKSIFIAPELLDPKQYTAVLDTRLFEKGDIWSLGCLLLYLLYDGMIPKWYTNRLGVREADCSMFLGSYASNFVKTNMINSNPHKRISISDVLKFVSTARQYNDPIQFLSSLSTPKVRKGTKGSPRSFPDTADTQTGPSQIAQFTQRVMDEQMNHHHQNGKRRKKKKYNNNPIDSMINRILKTNSQIFYNRLMVNFWDNNNDKEILRLMVERVYMSASIISNRSSLTAIKLLTLLHRLFLQTPQEFMNVSIDEIKFYNQLIEFWKIDSSQDFMKDLVISYAKFMIVRLKFHSKNPMFESNFSLSLFMYNHHRNEYVSFDCNKWFDDISQSFIDLIDFGTNHCSLINAILSHKGFNTSLATQYASAIDVGNILNNCLIPLFEDLHSLYLVTTWIIGLLRISFGKKKITIYSDKYKDFMISLIAVVTRIQNTAMLVWNCIDIDTKQFPKQVPKISSIALLDLYPPSSFAPNLSAFNRELVNYFVEVINRQKNKKNNPHHGHIKKTMTMTHITSDDELSAEETQQIMNERRKHLPLQRAKTQNQNLHQISDDTTITVMRHNRSRSSLQVNGGKTISANSRTPPPRNSSNTLMFGQSSPNIFPDIDDMGVTPTPQKTNKDTEHHVEHKNEHKEQNETIKLAQPDEVKEELSFRPLSRSISSDTNIGPDSPMNPFATLPSTKAGTMMLSDIEIEDETAFIFKTSHDIILKEEENHNNDDDDDEDEDESDSSEDLNHDEHSSQFDEPNHNKHDDLKIEEEEEKNKKEDELKWEEIVIIERIGIGGFAEVFSGKIRQEQVDEFDDEPEDKVAIKKLINQNLTPHNLNEFSSEIEIMRKIKHPNITKFIGACTKSPHMCIVTELLEMSLFDLLHNTRLKLSIEIEIKIGLGATKGVAHLHEHDIIHRDLKSANILLDKHFEPRITDFGLSRMKDHSTLTAGTGTFQWMAPEVIQGKKYDEKSDIYSLAMIFWEIKTGLIPFVSYRLNGIQASVAVVTQKKRPKIDSSVFKNKKNYNEWKTIIIKMWSQSPSKRPNANEVIKLLDTI